MSLLIYINNVLDINTRTTVLHMKIHTESSSSWASWIFSQHLHHLFTLPAWFIYSSLSTFPVPHSVMWSLSHVPVSSFIHFSVWRKVSCRSAYVPGSDGSARDRLGWAVIVIAILLDESVPASEKIETKVERMNLKSATWHCRTSSLSIRRQGSLSRRHSNQSCEIWRAGQIAIITV